MTCTGTESRRIQSLRGHVGGADRGLPTALPVGYRSILESEQPVWASPL
jgi:hypothetical protein